MAEAVQIPLSLTAVNHQRLIPNIIDHHAAEDPKKVWTSIPHDDDDISKGFRDISYRQFRNAVNKASHWVESALGPSIKDTFATFAYYGPRDLRYAIFLVAAMKTGRKMLSASLLCALDAHVHLVRSTESRVLLCTKSTLPLVEKIESQYSPAQHFIVPDLLDFLPVDAHEGDQWPIYPYDATWDTAKDHPCLVIHTSGSTGLPKLVAYTHRMLAGPARSRYIPPLNGCTPIYQEFADRRMFFTLPIFHLVGFLGFLICPIYFDCVGVMAPPDKPITPKIADEVHRYGRLDGGLYHPSLLEDIVRDVEKRERLRSMKAIFFSGAPLETSCGNWIASNTGALRNGIGSTEGFSWPALVSADPVEDWGYLHLYPVNGIKFVPVGVDASSGAENELYELVVERTPETDHYTNFFQARPGTDVWRTRDLWKPHPDPTKTSHWLYQGRADDLVVLSGEVKMYAAQLEAKITGHPLIREALVGGKQRKWPFLLLELVNVAGNNANAAFEDDVWPWIDKLNSESTHEAVRLQKSLVVITDPERPFVRLAKGSMSRQQTLQLYEKDIDALYSAIER